MSTKTTSFDMYTSRFSCNSNLNISKRENQVRGSCTRFFFDKNSSPNKTSYYLKKKDPLYYVPWKRPGRVNKLNDNSNYIITNNTYRTRSCSW